MMSPNPIEEIKQIRHELGAAAQYSIHRVFAELRELEATSGRSYVRHSPRRLSDNNGVAPKRPNGAEINVDRSPDAW